MSGESPRRAIVTGGSGFIGTHLVEALAASGNEVLSLDIRPPAIAGHARLWRSTDILDEANLAKSISVFAPNIIYNLAANADIAKSGAAFAVNTQGLQHIIDAASHMTEPAHIVHASTQLVVSPQYSPSGPRDYFPYTEYGASKALSEELLWNAPGQPQWTIVRPTTVWGPGHPSFANSIWRYIAKRWYVLPTGADPIRSYGYVGNVVHQLMSVANARPDAVIRQVFYLGDEPVRSSVWLDGFSKAMTGKPVRRVPGALLRAAAWIGELSGKVGGPSPINRGRLFRMTTDYDTPMEPAFAVLGRGPYSFEEGVRASIAWLESRR